MRQLRYTIAAARDLGRHANVAERVRRAISEYATAGKHENNVTQLVGSPACRLRVGAFRVIFEDDGETITVTRVGPRGDVYD